MALTSIENIAKEKADSGKYADAWKTGGGGVWMTPAYDAELNLIFLAVGNPSPDLDGGIRPGDNLYTTPWSRWTLRPARQVVLPDGAARHMGPRRVSPPAICDGSAEEGRRARRQDRLGVHPRRGHR